MRTFAFILILSVLSFAGLGLVAPKTDNLPPGVSITTTERPEDPDANIRAIPIQVWVLINGQQVFQGEVGFVNQHWYGPAQHCRIFLAGPHQFVAIDIPPGSDVLVSTKPPTEQSTIPLFHFALRLMSDGAQLYAGEPWEFHIQREASDTGIAVMVATASGSEMFKLDYGDHVVARSFIP